MVTYCPPDTYTKACSIQTLYKHHSKLQQSKYKKEEEGWGSLEHGAPDEQLVKNWCEVGKPTAHAIMPSAGTQTHWWQPSLKEALILGNSAQPLALNRPARSHWATTRPYQTNRIHDSFSWFQPKMKTVLEQSMGPQSHPVHWSCCCCHKL